MYEGFEKDFGEGDACGTLVRIVVDYKEKRKVATFLEVYNRTINKIFEEITDIRLKGYLIKLTHDDFRRRIDEGYKDKLYYSYFCNIVRTKKKIVLNILDEEKKEEKRRKDQMRTINRLIKEEEEENEPS